MYTLIQNPENEINRGKPVYQHNSGNYYLYSIWNQYWMSGRDYTSSTAYQYT